MATLTIATTEITDAATILESQAFTTTLPASNMQTIQPTEIARADGGSSPYVEFDLGAAYAINLVSMMYTNATSSTDWRVRLATSQANLISSPGYDSGTVDFWPGTLDVSDWERTHSLDWQSGSVSSYQYARIDISSHTGDFDCGRVIIDAAHQFSLNPQYGYKPPSFEERVTRKETYGGNIKPSPRARTLSTDFVLQLTDRDEFYSYLYEMSRLQGTSEPILFIEDPAADDVHRHMVYGLLSRSLDVSIPAYSLYNARMKIEEMV